MKKRVLVGLILGSMCINLIGCGKTEKGTTVVSEDSTNPTQNTVADNRVELDEVEEETTENEEPKDIVAEANTLNRFEQFNERKNRISEYKNFHNIS